MDIFQKVVDAIVDEMDFSPDGAELIEKAAENPDGFGYLAEGLGVEQAAVLTALQSEAVTVAGFAAQLGVEEEDVTKLLWANARFRQDMEADSLDLVGLIIALENLSEEEFGLKIEIPDDEAQKIASVGSAVAYLKELVAGRETTAV